ncbi:putative baseplate assembly protein [Streptomyces jumonjinensis]|uniref:putative baseplate assembly protein n=1 Tax=Streptomyces jumonjinensis TaxID=1945 RepID=UPI00379B586C
MSGFPDTDTGCGTACGCGCGGHDERHAPRALYNPPGRTSLDYRVGEYGSFLAAMLDRLASPAYPALRGLTVRAPDDPAIALVDAWAVAADLLAFHSERIADEGYLRTAREQRSLELLGRLVGHRPRPGVAADTHLVYTLDRDPRDAGTPVLIPRGARSASVPASAGQAPQTFETGADLSARAAWNELAVRRRRPDLLTADGLAARSEIWLEGTSLSLRAGDRLLFVFGEGPPPGGRRLLLPVTRVRVDRDDGVTAIGLSPSPPRSLRELVAEVRRWIAEDPPGDVDGEPTPDHPHPRPESLLIEEFDAQVLAPLRADLDGIGSAARFAARLAGPQERLGEAQAVAAAHEAVAAWFERLEAVVAELRERAAELEPVRSGEEPATGDSAALRALRAVLPALRAPARRPVPRTAGGAVGPGPELSARLLAALDPRLGEGMYAAWRGAAAAEPPLLRAVQALRVTAAPFGATAPLRSVTDDRGRVIRQTDWPLGESTLTMMRVVFDTSGRDPVRAEFQYTESGSSVQRSEQLPADTSFALGPGRVSLQAQAGQDLGLSRLVGRAEGSREPGVTARFEAALPEVTLGVSRPADDGRVEVTVHSGEPLVWRLSPGEHRQAAHGGFEVSVRYTGAGEPPNVEIGVATVPARADRRVLSLDSVYDTIAVGSWVAIERPRKGAEGGVPGDPALALVTTRVTGVRTAAYTGFGITGRGSELTLADPWLDEHDVLLSTIRDAVVHTGGETLRLAGEPLGDEVHGHEIELAELYHGLAPGRQLMVSGERTDVPGTSGVYAAERAVIAAVEQYADPRLPGDHVHTRIALTADLGHRYRRDTVRVQGNVVAATHGESRDEPIGSGDSSRPGQTFTLWQSPLTWLPAGNPLGALPVLEVRVDGLLWHETDSLAGRGPRDRVYATGTAGDGRTTVTFGDGVQGARLPTGHENVRARYRFGSGRAANVGAGRITQAVTRPLGVNAVTNPLPATGGADADGPGLTRRTVPLAVSALDRLVSVADYEDFARSRAGIGRAVAREVFDGRRTVLHLTVAGVDDVPVAEDSGMLAALRSALARYGDTRLPVRVAVRELVQLLLWARVKVAPDHSWAVVEPLLRQALLRRFGSGERELGVPARLSDVLASAHSVAGVEYVDVDVFTGVTAATAAARLAGAVEPSPRTDVAARLAAYREEVHRVTADGGESLTSVAARHGIPLAELLRLNPDITDTRPLAKGRAVSVFRGIRPAQLALLSPGVEEALVLTEAPS